MLRTHSSLPSKGSQLVTLTRMTSHGLWVPPSRLHFNVMLVASVLEPTVLERGQRNPSSPLTLTRVVQEVGLSGKIGYSGCEVGCRDWSSQNLLGAPELSFTISTGQHVSGRSKGLCHSPGWPTQEVMCVHGGQRASVPLFHLLFLNAPANRALLTTGTSVLQKPRHFLYSVSLCRHQIHREADKRNYN